MLVTRETAILVVMETTVAVVSTAGSHGNQINSIHVCKEKVNENYLLFKSQENGASIMDGNTRLTVQLYLWSQTGTLSAKFG